MSAPTTLAITEPGVYDIPDSQYHGIKDRLSCSGARKLLPPSCPAIYRYELDHPPESKPHYDFGHLAHKKVLGAGAPVREVKADDWRTAKAQQARKEAYAAGEIPVLTSELAIVDQMAAVIRAHPIASALFDPDHGQPEQSLMWTDEATGVPLRARLDWLPEVRPGRRMIVPDYKTAISANPQHFSKAAADYGYEQQDSFYRAGVRALELDEAPAFIFLVQMKTPPYLITPVELDDEAKRIGEGLNARAIELFADCVANDDWPSYTTDVAPIAPVSLPKWFLYQNEEFLL